MALYETLVQRDTRANQPAASSVPVGTLYYVTDELVTERSNGTSWDDFSDSGGSSAPEDASFVTLGVNATLSNERVLTGSGRVSVTDAGAGSTVTLDVPDGGITYAKVQDVSAGSKLLGRGDSGSGDVQEIALGSGLSMSGTTLSASAVAGSTLDELSDVMISSPPSDGDVLVYESSSPAGWVNTATPQLTRVGIGVSADSSAKLLIDGQYGSTTNDAGNSGTSKTIDWNDGNTQLLTLTGNCTITLSNPKDGFRYLIALEQDGTGSRTVTWPSDVLWQADTAPTLSTAAGAVDIVTLVYFDALGGSPSGRYLAAANTDYTP